MRISTEHYASLNRAISTMPTNATERERWDSLWAAVDSGRLEWSMLNEYNDSHIDTALRQISTERETN